MTDPKHTWTKERALAFKDAADMLRGMRMVYPEATAQECIDYLDKQAAAGIILAGQQETSAPHD